MKTTSTTKQTLKLFWRFTEPNRFLFWYGTIGSVLGTLTGAIFPPLIVSEAFNHIQYLFSTHQAVTLAAMTPYLVLFVVCMLFNLAIWRTQAWSVWTYQAKAEQRISEALFAHLQSMDNRFHSDRFGGALVSQVNKFVAAYDRFTSDFSWNIINGLSAYIAALVVLFFKGWQYALVFTVLSALYATVVYHRMKKQVPINRSLSSQESLTTAKLADNITNVSTVRAFAGEEIEEAIFHKQTEQTKHAAFKLISVQMRNEFLSQSWTTTLNIISLLAGLLLVIHGTPIGVLYLVLTYNFGLTDRLWQFMFIVRNLNRNFGDAAEMTDILQLEPEVKDPAKAEAVNIKDGGISFEDVDFAYPDNSKQQLFRNLNLTIKPGEKVGLVGHSGGGKTSLTKLLLRFTDIDNGTIRIDGQDIAAISQHDLRSHIAYVPQEPLMFHRSIADNIRYGNIKASLDDMKTTSRLAHADEFIQQLAEGYDTLVGERGIKLSGGQRQRVAIARAMLKDAPILVLDEATSALDSESEVLIQDALWKLMEGRTAIVIAHRLSTIQKMDRIIVLDKGKIVEQGTHKELVGKNGTYAKLWAHQSGGFLED